jgi:hypothetical protein
VLVQEGHGIVELDAQRLNNVTHAVWGWRCCNPSDNPRILLNMFNFEEAICPIHLVHHCTSRSVSSSADAGD